MKKHTTKIFFLFAIMSLLFTSCKEGANCENIPFTTSYINISGLTIKVYVADTPPLRAKGLSGIKNISFKEGMLFVHSKPDTYIYWMKGMLFALDFIWIKNGKVVGTSTNIPPPSSPEEPPAIVTPPCKVDSILEVKAGFVKKYNIKKGDKVKILTPYKKHYNHN